VPAELDFCYLTTTGRTTGNPHTIEIWFGTEGDRLYLLSGGGDRSDWVKNIRAHPEVEVRLDDDSYAASARIVEDAEEDTLARRLLLEKYGERGEDLVEWGRTALPIALDLVPS
jgi:deazaflavin-dependent oxidoreductase (nitroreductase family)